MKLWKKAAGLIKDRNSIWAASISRRTSYRNPDLESIVIKATSHDELHVDYKHFHRVYEWVRTSPIYVKPLLYAISSRMEKTRSWVVALKGLMLMHGVFCCKIPAVQRIGRLPFDLSNFTDGHSNPSKTWAYDAFVRAYFTYLDQRSSFLQETATSAEAFKKQQQLGRLQAVGLDLQPQEEEPPLTDEIVKLRKWQALMAMLLEIKPHPGTARVYLVFEAMICILTEIFDVYSRICKAIAKLLVRIYAAPGKEEAQMALAVVQMAVTQGQELESYLEFCRELGALGSSECPKVKQIPEEDIKDLEKIIREASDGAEKEKEEPIENSKAIVEMQKGDDDLLILFYDHDRQRPTKKKMFKTIITDKWEVFPDDDMISWVSTGYNDASAAAPEYNNPFASSSSLMPHVAPSHNHNPILPDLISF
ncbi:putative clathrin assembly protein At1g25240 [Argentina anserina]|uniref:putative clathrin assembly protein At1g25240 n=1 Tax=Argentina anserina TaxID=57926 RepID=UPI0021766B01|nr:putative clathrin assembly protein At1g25240 [Potentilla anserina]